MNRGQSQSSIFTFITMAIMVSLLFAIGAVGVGRFVSVFNQAEKTQFQSQVTGDLAAIQTRVGSFRTHSYTIPNGATEICFFSTNTFEPENCLRTDRADHPIVNNALQGAVEDSIFLLSGNRFERTDLGDVHISVDDTGCDLICIPVTSKTLILKMDGRGSFVEVSVV